MIPTRAAFGLFALGVLCWNVTAPLSDVQAAEIPPATQASEAQKPDLAEADNVPDPVHERGLEQGAVPAPPYSCGSGVCLCAGQNNCSQMTQPQPCKREKFCVGQTAGPPPPLPPQEPALSKRIMPNTTRTTSLNLLICSCRSGQ